MELSPLHAQSSASSLIHGWVQWQHRAFAEGRKDFDTRHYLLTQSCGCEIHFSKDSCDNAYFSLKALLAELLESFENPQQSAGIPASNFYVLRPFISSSFWSPPCFPHLLSHYLKPKPNPPMQESNRRSPTPTEWCISRLTRMNRSGYNNSETNMRSNGKKNSGGEAEAYGYKRKSIAVYHVQMIRKGAIPSEELHLQKSSWVVNCDWKCLIHVVAFEFRSNARAFLLPESESLLRESLQREEGGEQRAQRAEVCNWFRRWAGND
ncbi:hypothetical protein DVH24_038661 [Malus domestica]|uniref:Uncharacterized protein n=1 Tax=Malus domestica TaxID=3750 RepID=A0A498KAL9_MALDO|nr:hypothetical protein DVH24_038661 [Malus domestica]